MDNYKTWFHILLAILFIGGIGLMELSRTWEYRMVLEERKVWRESALVMNKELEKRQRMHDFLTRRFISLLDRHDCICTNQAIDPFSPDTSSQTLP